MGLILVELQFNKKADCIEFVKIFYLKKLIGGNNPEMKINTQFIIGFDHATKFAWRD